MLPNEPDFESVLAELARGNVVAEGNFEDVLQFLLKRAAETLAVQRVSFWLFDDNHCKLVCSSIYDSTDDTCCQGEELLADEYPLYFSAMEKMRTIAAIDAESDARTIELRETYLRRHHIKTMLDAPVFLHGEVIGVVCHEQSRLKREWTDHEKSFAGSIADFISLALEANHRIETERKLRETEILLGTVTEQMSDGFCLLEPAPEAHELVVRYVNPSGAEMNGYANDELVGQSSSIFRVRGHYVDLYEFISDAEGHNQTPTVFETVAQRKNGTTFPVEIVLNQVQHQGKTMLAVIGRDVTARQAAEQSRIESQAKNLQAERLASLGMLAGKIAHDFNNLLVGIISNASLAKLNLPSENAASRYLNNVESTAQMAADLCNQLLIYSGKQQLELRNINLSELVEQMSPLLAVSLPPNVTLQREIDSFLPPIAAEPTQVRQILLNLVTNAADAVRKNGGTIKIETRVKPLGEEDLQRNRFAVQAKNFVANNQSNVCLIVKDDGEGMTAEIRQKMFEPFFTTKDTGRGLGMATLAGIVYAHGGAIEVESEPAQGTTVGVWFPALNE